MSTSTNPHISLTEIGRNSVHCFVRYDVHKVFKSLPAVTLTFDLRPNQYMSQALIHKSPNFGEISSNIYEYILFTRFFWVIACCDLNL